MASLYFHTLPGASSAAIDRASIGARWLKLCDSGQIVRAHGHGCKVFWRPFLSERDAGDCGDGASWAGEVWRDLQANGGEQPECVSFRNEMNASVRNAAEYLRYRATLRSFGYRGLVALGSFAVGTPDWPEWALLKQGLAGNVPDCCEVHEYWDLTIPGSATYYALRHVEAIRRGLLPPEWPLFPGEVGSDGIWKELDGGRKVPVEDPQGRRGWQDRGKLTAAQQSANLAAYAAGCAPSVAAAFVFADGTADPNWATFRTFDTPVEAAIRATWPGNAPQSRQDAPQGTVAAQTAPAPVVALPPPVATPAGPVAPPIARRGHHPMADVPELDQGWTSACWAYATAECFDASGYYVSPMDIYAQVKGKIFAPPGDPATFDELRHGINAASAMTGARIKWFGPLGIANDPATVDQLVKDGWYVVAGLAEQMLQGPSQTYGHYVVLRKIDYDKDGTPEMSIVDSYRAEDGGTDRYPLAQLHSAMAANWDSGVDALAFQIVS